MQFTGVIFIPTVFSPYCLTRETKVLMVFQYLMLFDTIMSTICFVIFHCASYDLLV
jgi:hypothetical protein